MLRRLAIYIKEMFPLQVYVPYTLVSFFGLYFISQVSQGADTLIIARSSLIGVFTVFGVMLLMRIFDEFKDIETDKRLFPGRPCARGAVKYSDIRFLGWVFFIVMLLLNIFMTDTILFFIAMMIFAFLTFKWFFKKELISNSLVLALITHQPLTLFVNAYIVATAFHLTGSGSFNGTVIAGILAFFFPITAWETSRKIRAAGKETDYTTYSKLFGPVRASLLPFTSILITTALSAYIGFSLQFSLWFFIVITILFVQFAYFYLRFMIFPTEANLKVRPVAEYTGTLLFVVLILQIFLKYNFIIKL